MRVFDETELEKLKDSSVQFLIRVMPDIVNQDGDLILYLYPAKDKREFNYFQSYYGKDSAILYTVSEFWEEITEMAFGVSGLKFYIF